VSHAAEPTRWESFGSFTTGAYDSYVLVETAAGAGGIQIDFTLLGARRFIGAPLDWLANHAVSLDEIFGTKGRERVLRFQRAVEVLKTNGSDRLADVALDCGYDDQPHFDRDFRVFAGVTPTDLFRTRRPDGGFAAEA
jgi:hypothetical protein